MAEPPPLGSLPNAVAVICLTRIIAVVVVVDKVVVVVVIVAVFRVAVVEPWGRNSPPPRRGCITGTMVDSLARVVYRLNGEFGG